jgi:hypothetical protein
LLGEELLSAEVGPIGIGVKFWHKLLICTEGETLKLVRPCTVLGPLTGLHTNAADYHAVPDLTLKDV